MLRSTLYPLLLLPAFLLHTANARFVLNSINTVQYPNYYAVHNGNDAAGDPVKLSQKTAPINAPPGSNLVVYQNETVTYGNAAISNPNGDLFIGPNSDNSDYTLKWVSEPFPWIPFPIGDGSVFSLRASGTGNCWHHTPDAATIDLRKCPSVGGQDEMEYAWKWDSPLPSNS